MATPLAVHHLEVVESTQDEARGRHGAEPVLVTATAQRAGRGRSGASWQTAPRALAASLAWSPHWPPETVSLITLVAGLAALDTLGERVGLKWPNDLVIGDVKVGGILSERFGEAVVVGIGVNLYWPQAPPGVGALHDRDPGPDTAPHLAEQWARHVLARVGAGPAAWGREEYLARCVTLGRAITWEPEGSGVAQDVTPVGSLVVATAHGVTTIDSGAVRTVRTVGEEDDSPLP